MDEMLRDEKFAAELEGYRGAPARTPDPPAGGAAASDSGASSAEAAGPDSGWWVDAIDVQVALAARASGRYLHSNTIIIVLLTAAACVLLRQKAQRPSNSRPWTS